MYAIQELLVERIQTLHAIDQTQRIRLLPVQLPFLF
jgi:hypothetical protein